MTKKEILKKAKESGIEIETNKYPDGTMHIHLYSPIGFKFSNSTVHNACLYDGPNIKAGEWEKLDPTELDLFECDEGPECDVCKGRFLLSSRIKKDS